MSTVRVKVRHESRAVTNVRAGGEAFGYLVLFAVFIAPIVFAIKFWYVSVPLIALVLLCVWFNARYQRSEARKARERAEAEAASAVTAPIAIPQHVIEKAASGRHAMP